MMRRMCGGFSDGFAAVKLAGNSAHITMKGAMKGAMSGQIRRLNGLELGIGLLYLSQHNNQLTKIGIRRPVLLRQCAAAEPEMGLDPYQ